MQLGKNRGSSYNQHIPIFLSPFTVTSHSMSTFSCYRTLAKLTGHRTDEEQILVHVTTTTTK